MSSDVSILASDGLYSDGSIKASYGSKDAKTGDPPPQILASDGSIKASYNNGSKDAYNGSI